MFEFLKLKSPIGRSYNTEPDDVLKTKKALNGLGYYDEPSTAITEYPDSAMFLGIEKLQKDNGLKQDGVMKPGGETERSIGSMMNGQLQTKVKPKASEPKPTTLSSLSSLLPKKPKQPVPKPVSTNGLKLGEALKLSAPIGMNQKNDPSDVKRANKAMGWTWLYPTKKAEQQDGRMDQDLMRSIGMFQSANGLKQDFWMRPYGETVQSLDGNLKNKLDELLKFADARGGDKPDDPPSEGGNPPDDGDGKPGDPPDDDEENPDGPPDEVPDEKPCEELKEQMEGAWDAHDQLQDDYLKLLDDQDRTQAELERTIDMDIDEFLTDENSDTTSKYPSGRVGMEILDKIMKGSAERGNNRGYARALKRERIMILREELAEITKQINELEAEREKARENAEQASEAFKQCEQENSGKKEKETNISQ